jgi:hypothetical protein
MVNLPRIGVSLALSILVCAGCALLNTAQNKVQTVEKQVVEPSLEVLACAKYIQRTARDNGKELPVAAALAFCTAFMASPDVAGPALPDVSGGHS